MSASRWGYHDPVDEGALRELLGERFGFADFRPGQLRSIRALLDHNAALAVFPTGGGKSLVYQLTALAIEGVTLVVSPLIALMKDQIDFLQRHGIPAARLDSSLTADEVRAINDDLRAGQLKLLYVAPERFNNERFLSELDRLPIGLFAVDEAHCISEWGHNFRPDYLKLARAARDIGAERVLALTATATPPVIADVQAAFNIPEEATVVTGFYRKNTHPTGDPCDEDRRDRLLLERMKTRRPGPCIVYVTLQKTAERVARLIAQGLPAGGLPCRTWPRPTVRRAGALVGERRWDRRRDHRVRNGDLQSERALRRSLQHAQEPGVVLP